MGVSVKDGEGKEVGVLENGLFTIRNTRPKRDLWIIEYDVLFNVLPDRCDIVIEDVPSKTRYSSRSSAWKEYGDILPATDDTPTRVGLPRVYFVRTPL